MLTERGDHFSASSRRRARRANWLWILLGSGWFTVAFVMGQARAQTAQDAEPSKPKSEVRLQMPRLVEFIEAEYPEAMRGTGRVVLVQLTLTVDAQGRVIAASVTSPQGYGFDEAATRAAMRLRFEPANRDGQPIAAKIRFEYTFRWEDIPPPSTATERRSDSPAPESGQTAGETARPPATPVVTSPSRPIEVTVRGDTEADRLRQSAMPVEVIETERAQRASADLAEVLTRSTGVTVARSGGLGSETRVALNGLTDDQIRFFLDGVPLEFSGFGLGISTVPVNLIERLEVYAGVVPIRFGADALGGAIHLVTDQTYRGTHAATSYQLGSFATHRATATVRHRFEPSGLVASGSGFIDYSANSYPIDVEVANDKGRPVPVRVRRFHDGYRAQGGNVEFGVVDRPWAKRLLLRLFATDFSKEIQHNVNMSVPYGEMVTGESVQGGTLRYEQRNLFSRRLALSVIGGYSHRVIKFQDLARRRYDWFGRYRGPEPDRAGEFSDLIPRSDLTQWEEHLVGRVSADIQLTEGHALHLTVASNYAERTGKERLRFDPNRLDPQTTRGEVVTVVSGLEYQAYAVKHRLENSFFIKDYLYDLSTAQVDTLYNSIRALDRETHHLGVGDGLTFRPIDWLRFKASYELATRLPRPDEIFGNGAIILRNPSLEPESSHNANVSASLDWSHPSLGAVRGAVQTFLRYADNVIVLEPTLDRTHENYANVDTVRSLGVEGVVGWTSAGGHLSLDGNLTYLDLRNVSETGPRSAWKGERLPNRPWLFAHAAATLTFAGVNAANDELSLAWTAHYVHEFFPSWDKAGVGEKTKIPSQLIQSLGLMYIVRAAVTVSSALEVQNLADTEAYDVLGVQKPGRAFFFKGTAEY